MELNLRFFGVFGVVLGCVIFVEATTIFQNAIDNSPFNIRAGYTPSFSSFGPFGSPLLKRRCPVCDSSVYGYCSEKLFHDSCCCNNPNNPYDQLPYQCQYADCSFLHANSCREHKLITACCCTNYLAYRK